MLESVVNAVIATLREAGLDAARSYEPLPLRREGGARICVGIRELRCTEGGLGAYLGLRSRSSDGEAQESYALRCEVTLALDVYAPKGEENAAGLCAAAFDRAVLALSGAESGLRAEEISCGEAVPDEESGMFRCRGSLRARVWLLLERDEESGSFTDFKLRGERMQ